MPRALRIEYPCSIHQPKIRRRHREPICCVNLERRKGEYFRRELTIGNSSAVWQGVTVSDGATTTTGNLFLPATPENYTYDLDGNLTQDGRWDYVWDAENRLTRMTSRSGAPSGSVKRLEFVYDHQGRRIGKKVWNNTAGTGDPALNQKLVYDGWNLIAVLYSSSSLLSSFTWGLDLSGSIQGAGGVGGLLAVIIWRHHG